jgi:hypothetical protein
MSEDAIFSLRQGTTKVVSPHCGRFREKRGRFEEQGFTIAAIPYPDFISRCFPLARTVSESQWLYHSCSFEHVTGIKLNGKWTEILRTQLIAGLPHGTRGRLLPLLPSGPDGVHNLPLRETQLSAVSVKHETGTTPTQCRYSARRPCHPGYCLSI